LEKYQRLKEKGTEVQPSSSLVERCANIAVTILESTPYEISDGELEQHGVVMSGFRRKRYGAMLWLWQMLR